MGRSPKDKDCKTININNNRINRAMRDYKDERTT